MEAGKELRYTSPDGWELRGGTQTYQPSGSMEDWSWREFVKLIEQCIRLAFDLSIYDRHIFRSVGRTKRFDEPKVGDIVCEITSMGEPSLDGKRVGRLLEVDRGPICSPEEWVSVYGGEVGEAVPDQKYWRVQTPDGDVLWTNARFVRVPDCWQVRSHIEKNDTVGLKTARRCPDCGVQAYMTEAVYTASEGWWVFGPDGRCRICRSGRPMSSVPPAVSSRPTE